MKRSLVLAARMQVTEFNLVPVSMIDWDKIDEVTLALMHLTTFEDRGAIRSWKGHDWDVLNRLFERGWISDPVSKAKSVVLSADARKRSEELFLKHFGRAV